jgi:hypothetical protein
MTVDHDMGRPVVDLSSNRRRLYGRTVPTKGSANGRLDGAPHATFDHFVRLLDEPSLLEEISLATVVSRVAPNGTAAAELQSALRWLGLTHDEAPAEVLTSLAKKEDRAGDFGSILEQRYSSALRRLEAGATRDELLELFMDGRGKKTCERAVSFFLRMALEAGVEGARLPRRQTLPYVSATVERESPDLYEGVLVDALRRLGENLMDDRAWDRFCALADRIEMLREVAAPD